MGWWDDGQTRAQRAQAKKAVEQYPSLSALTQLKGGGDYATFTERYVRRTFLPPGGPGPCSETGRLTNPHLCRVLVGLDDKDLLVNYHKDVRMSLRFIFCGSPTSRKLARKLIRSNLDGDRDKVLLKLSRREPMNLLHGLSKDRDWTKREFLTPWADFRLLGGRLLALQRHNAAQKSARVCTDNGTGQA